MKPQNILFALSFLAVSAPGAADAKLAKEGGSTATFNATGPGGLKITGTTNELEVKEDGGQVTVIVPLRNVDTGIGLRNKHMREKYLQTDQFPNAELTVPRASLKFPSGGEVSASATGTMKIHGKSQPVSFQYTAKPSGAGIQISGSAKLNMKDYGIEVPSYLGVTVKPEVDVAATFSVTDR